jgi:hypothetical protein
MRGGSIVVVAIATCAALGQEGQVSVSNYSVVAGIDAPVFDADCVTRLAGNAYLAQLYCGKEPTALSPVGLVTRFRVGVNAGYMVPLIVTIPENYGSPVFVQIRAWEAASGASYEASVASGGQHGISNILEVRPVVPLPPPADLVGLQSFCLVPEPAPRELLLVGGLVCALAWKRHRRRIARRSSEAGGGHPRLRCDTVPLGVPREDRWRPAEDPGRRAHLFLSSPAESPTDTRPPPPP